MRGTNFIARQQGAVLSLPLLACVTAIWLVSIHGLDPERMGNLGLISLLPPAFYVALGILAVSFAVVVHRRETATAILFLHVLLLTLIVRATPVILYGTVRYAWTYKHLAIVDYIQRHGGVDRTIDYLSIYHNWPGFFAIAALLTQAAGLQSAASFANWAPVFFDLLAVPALLLIYRSFTADRRLIWLGIWLFEIGNWVGQDYFSPQALGYTLFLYIVGICLQWFGAHPHLPREADGRGAEAGRWAIIRRALARRSPEREPPEQPATLLQRGALFACVALLAFVVVSSHQLSPFMIISALTSLVVFRQSRTWILPALVTLLTAIWYVWAAEPYVRSHLATILDSLGDLTANVTAHSAAVSLPADQLLVARVAQGLTALVLVLAVLGAVRRLRHGRLDLACILLVLAPIPWLVVTHYGTEILFRVYLFALPFAAFFGAALFYPAAGVATARRTIALTALAGVAMLALFCGSYYGHEKMNFVSPAEVAALQRFERIAPPGSLLVQGSWDAPVPYHNYELYHYLSLQEMSDSVRHAMGRDPVGVIEEQIQAGPRYSNAYLLVTRSQEVDLRDIGLAPAHLLKRVQSGVERSPDFTLVYRNRDAALYLLAPDRASSGTTF
ncbi:MAG: hypothetical protein JOZ41_14160 [Chloroflexi bacterium]|nr:hypothetical protein [Chloroflexota bacterium]